MCVTNTQSSGANCRAQQLDRAAPRLLGPVEPAAALWPAHSRCGEDAWAPHYGRQFDAPSMERSFFKPTLAGLGFASMTWHGLRGYFASPWAAAHHISGKPTDGWVTPT